MQPTCGAQWSKMQSQGWFMGAGDSAAPSDMATQSTLTAALVYVETSARETRPA